MPWFPVTWCKLYDHCIFSTHTLQGESSAFCHSSTLAFCFSYILKHIYPAFPLDSKWLGLWDGILVKCSAYIYVIDGLCFGCNFLHHSKSCGRSAGNRLELRVLLMGFCVHACVFFAPGVSSGSDEMRNATKLECMGYLFWELEFGDCHG